MTKASRRSDNTLERFRARLIFAFSVSLFGIAVQAQEPSRTQNPQQSAAEKPSRMSQENTGPRRIQAKRVTEAIKIDGILDEPAWSLAQPATDFLQQQPHEGTS